MRGHLRKRSKGSWTIVLDVGTDAVTGKRKQRWIAVRGTKREAEAKLAKLIRAANEGSFVEPSKITFGDWLETWLASVSDRVRPRTHERYKSLIENHLRPGLGSVLLQKLRSTVIEDFYREKRAASLSSSTRALLHVVIHSSLAAAERKRLVTRNEATLVENRPRQRDPADTSSILKNVWTPEDARAFLPVAREAGTQLGALFALALELGLRQSEIAALRWEDFNAERATLRVVHQLRRGAFVPLKSGPPRPLDLSAPLVGALLLHRRAQAELKLRNGRAYEDRALILAVEFASGPARLGAPLTLPNVARRVFPQLIAKAGVKPITFHGLRHTSATLALAAGVSVKIVAERLGHSKTSITLDLYSHVVPSLSQDAAARIGAILHG